MEKAVGAMVQERLTEDKGKDEIEKEVGALIRAFDPCMSCATHFLKVKWQ
jgi:coenzyme F420-reducing hydrogenase alpha subunit